MKKKNSFFENLKHPFLIAEISANHNGSLQTCLNLIKNAKKNGADAVKIQTYAPESMTINSIALAGLTKTFAYIIFLSTKSAVVVVSSKTSLYSVIPNLDLTSPNTASALDLNRPHVVLTF